MPSLRERVSDIPLLARHFMQKFSRRMNKNIETIPDEVMDLLMRWDWPGNVRELEHFVERSVILTKGTLLQAPVAELGMDPRLAVGPTDSLRTARREHIIKILRDAGGVISGPHGAAMRLGLKRTTLQSIMQRLGIAPKDYQD